MKKRLLIIFFSVIIICSSCSTAYAAASNQSTGITLDGSFYDWRNMPGVFYAEYDSSTYWVNYIEVKYVSSKDYLYLFVDRTYASSSSYWHFSVIMLNATKGFTNHQYPQFDVTTNYSWYYSPVVNVSFNGTSIESTYSASDNRYAVEFRIPLAQVGLNGVSKQVQFLIKADPNPYVYGGYLNYSPQITVTTGPTLWQLSSIIAFLGVSFLVYKKHKRKIKEII
ncbi:hypothetical protein BJV85_001366 [Clostridium acetobutylicum]|uniref:Firmicu-CTERM sorting domain-containing protein n=1 Tax=Clostridium acetobutylicum (strain ATCC 824 / DSM 792 / JCM 1419 / IAM 19013 / LMG 5710 / NBRC 13948 / NRRL B-527 / VKM B-1787 / 2291 / W) TaxID=272562 RepID=Q97G49_CLOAB|nr:MULTISPECIES: hypothetical protein [Clostridium]AAK80474.1 Hypothetical protein, CF-41 family [Clostridium acetobutylicum ATCC 824]ADZ21571.1 conserved hypothetical protein [Clostridium acetobutylicum EA 2018]AEI32407.1 hypothetical protein SMB_G2556 [Clostridium acetobutylicum DSM 1731]AWV79110.1 hypothetical protein DK921_03155 [Clostridium acetobutylicum]MBC2394929.1 hypothetical protein [Clostridium acetobutylicum]